MRHTIVDPDRLEPGGRSDSRPPATWWVPASIVLAFLTWPVWSTRVYAGLDASWQIALHLAAAHRMRFGHDLVFTYGPLGFLSQPVLVTAGTGTAAVLWVFATHLGFSALLVWRAAQSMPRFLAVLVAYAATAVIGALGYAIIVPDYLVFVALFLAVWMLERSDPPPAWALILGGVVAAVQLCVKLNGGVVCLLLLLLASWRARPGGIASASVLLASYCAAVIALWVITGNQLADLPTWIRLSGHVASSYTGIAAMEAPGRVYEYGLVATVGVLGSAAVLLLAKDHDPAGMLSLAAIWLVYSFAYLKEGFVRHDAHALVCFAALGIGLLAFTWRGGAGLLAAAALATTIAATAVAPELRGTVPLYPRRAASAAASSLCDALVPRRRDVAIDEGRAGARWALGIDSTTLADLRGKTVDVEPDKTAAVWAFGLDWRPEPVVQQYLAGNEVLDSYNADALASRGAERILRQEVWPALDGKHPMLEAPSTFRTLVCRYRQLTSRGGWAVFARADDRCATPRPIGSAHADSGDTVAVPPPPSSRDIVFARIHGSESVAARIAELLLKRPHQPTIWLDGELYRFVPATAEGPLILRLPAVAGISAPLGGAADYASLAVSGIGRYQVEFYAMELTSESMVPSTPSGSLTADRVFVDGRAATLVPEAVKGSVDAVSRHAGAFTVRGWAGDVNAGVAADEVAVFSGGRLLGSAHPSEPRPDVASVYRSPGMTFSGFAVSVAAGDVVDGLVQVVALSAGRASLIAANVRP